MPSHPKSPAVPLLIAICIGMAAAFSQCSPASGAPPAVVLTDSGVYLLSLDSDATPTISKATVIDRRSGSDEPGPDPDEPRDDSPDVELTLSAKGWAEAVGDPQTAQAMAMVYRQIDDSVAADKLTRDQAIAALREATDAVLMSRGSAAKWEPFRKSAGDELAKRMQVGAITDAASLRVFLKAVAHGLELAADGSDAIGFAEVIDVSSRINDAIDGAK